MTYAEMFEKLQEMKEIDSMIRALKPKGGISRALADDVAKRLNVGMTWEAARDATDLATGGELDAWQLDTLTDWSLARLQERQRLVR